LLPPPDMPPDCKSHLAQTIISLTTNINEGFRMSAALVSHAQCSGLECWGRSKYIPWLWRWKHLAFIATNNYHTVMTRVNLSMKLTLDGTMEKWK
jgi:hypothetical protein